MLFIWSYKKETNEYLTVNIATGETVAFSRSELTQLCNKNPKICANFWLVFGRLCGKEYNINKILSPKSLRVLCLLQNNTALSIDSDGVLTIVAYSDILLNLFHFSGISYYWTKHLGYPVSSYGNEFEVHVYSQKKKEVTQRKVSTKTANLLNTSEFAIRFAEVKALKEKAKGEL